MSAARISLGAVEGPAVTDATARDGTASPSPFEPHREYPNTRVAILADHVCRDLALLRAHMEGNGKRVMPMAAHADLERIQAELTATFVAWRNFVSDFPPVVTGHLSEAVA